MIIATRFANIRLRENRFFVQARSDLKPNKPIATGTTTNGLYIFDNATSQTPQSISPQRQRFLIPDLLRALHHEFGHAHPDSIRRMLQSSSSLNKFKYMRGPPAVSEPCAEGKMTPQSNSTATSDKAPLDKASADTTIPLPQDVHCKRYANVFIISIFPSKPKFSTGKSIFQILPTIPRTSRRQRGQAYSRIKRRETLMKTEYASPHHRVTRHR